MKYKVILFFTVIVAAIAGCGLGEFISNANLEYLAWLGYHKGIGFDDFTLNMVFFDLKFSLHMEIYIVQAILVLVAILIAPKIDALIKF